MNERVPLSRFMPYGAPDLQIAARPNLALALVVASSAAAATFALLNVLPLTRPIALPPLPHVYDVTTPDVIAPLSERTYAVRPSMVRPAGNAIGDVVPDEQVPIATSIALPDASGAPAGDPDGTVSPDVIQLGDPAPPETLPAFGAWQALESLPRALTRVTADYPEIARSAMVEGWVLVHVLVGRDGRIVEVRLDERRHVPMLDQAALDAARAFVFEPATSNGRAVAAWVDIPFHFTLH